jgi:hypothetical protein
MLIGSGSYGDVYHPNIIKSSNSYLFFSNVDQNFIGKITNTKLISKESQNNIEKKRKIFDPFNKFTVPYLGYCMKDVNNKNNKVWKNGKFNIQYIFPYAGKSIDNYKLPLKLFYNFFKHIQSMNEKGYFHMDITQKNVLYNKKNLILIDFDYLNTKDEIFEKFYNQQLFKNKLYYIWPLDINFVYNYKNIKINKLKTLPNEFKHILEKNIYNEQTLLHKINLFLESDYYIQCLQNPKMANIDYIDLHSCAIILKNYFHHISELSLKIDKFIYPTNYHNLNWNTFLITIYHYI